MAEIEELLATAHAVVEDWKRTQDEKGYSAVQARPFADVLAKLHEQGWDNALGWEHEPPDDYLPARYLQRRARILEELELELGVLAVRYRGSEEGSQEELQAVSRYKEIMEELFRIGHWSGEPDLDAQLPERHMPQVYKDYWEKRLAAYAASKSKGAS
jgi:hypothetical protein